jgi:hypothetical protein
MTLEELLADNAALSGRVQRSAEALKIALLTIDKMKVELTPNPSYSSGRAPASQVTPLMSDRRRRQAAWWVIAIAPQSADMDLLAFDGFNSADRN